MNDFKYTFKGVRNNSLSAQIFEYRFKIIIKRQNDNFFASPCIEKKIIKNVIEWLLAWWRKAIKSKIPLISVQLLSNSN